MFMMHLHSLLSIDLSGHFIAWPHTQGENIKLGFCEGSCKGLQIPFWEGGGLSLTPKIGFWRGQDKTCKLKVCLMSISQLCIQNHTASWDIKWLFASMQDITYQNATPNRYPWYVTYFFLNLTHTNHSFFRRFKRLSSRCCSWGLR